MHKMFACTIDGDLFTTSGEISIIYNFIQKSYTPVDCGIQKTKNPKEEDLGFVL